MLSKMQIKTIHALQHKKYRQKYSQFIAEGLKIVLELLKSEKITVKSLFITPDYREKIPDNLCQTVQEFEVNEKELKKISGLQSPQGVLAICHCPKPTIPFSYHKKRTLMLEAIRDPGNMGTIIRIADWFGIDQIVCSKDCVDIYNAKTIQSTMGSIARIPIASMDLATCLREKGKVPAFATTLEGESISSFDKIQEGIIIIGNESKGISKELIRLAETTITIPKIGGAESLNAAVATGIICSHLIL